MIDIVIDTPLFESPIILINEFESNPDGADSGKEWIELYNPNDEDVDISDWELRDSLGSGSPKRIYLFSTGTEIDSNSYLVVNLSGSNLNNGNGGDKVVLKDNYGEIIDESIQKEDNPDDDNCWARLPNAIDTDDDSDWIFQVCTKGWTNDDKDDDGYDYDNDCDDNDASVNPGADEVCDGVDNDCDAGTGDGSGETAPNNNDQDGVCSGSKQSCNGGSWTDDYSAVQDYEAAETSCDELDNDCDGSADTGLTIMYYYDFDLDKYGDASIFQNVCTQPDDYVTDSSDCNDNNIDVNPGEAEDCTNEIDDDCDGYEDGDDSDCFEAVADAGGPYECNEGETIILNGLGSYSDGEVIDSYEWDIDDDGIYGDISGANPDYDCEDDYDGKIGLKVTDSDSKEGTDEADLLVNNLAPTAEADGPVEGDTGVAVDFDGEGEDVLADSLSYLWDFGDGETSTEEDPSHAYADEGMYTVELTVTDDDGGSDTDSLQIRIYEIRQITLVGGISMFSLPLVPKEQVSFNDVQQNCLLDGLAYYDADKSAYNIIDASTILYPGQGYFVKVEDGCDLLVRGNLFDYDEGIVGYEGNGNLKVGWNMIGVASERTHYGHVIGDCIFTVEAGSSGPWIYDSAIGGYDLTSYLEPSSAYWVKVPDACSFNGQAQIS